MLKLVFSILGLLGLDLLTKSLVFSFMSFGQVIPVLPGVSLALAKNFGMGFGLGQGWTQVILILNIFVLLGFARMAFYEKTRLRWCWGLILAGGLGNAFDRLFLGFVRDFVLLSWEQYSWPIFNLADCYITFAVILVLLWPEPNNKVAR